PSTGGLDVLERVEPPGAVVGGFIGAAEPARAAHVGLDPRIALPEEEPAERIPPDRRAARRATVIADDHRQLLALGARGEEHVDGDLGVIDRLDLHDRRLDRRHALELWAAFLAQRTDLAGRDVDRVDVAGAAGRRP